MTGRRGLPSRAAGAALWRRGSGAVSGDFSTFRDGTGVPGQAILAATFMIISGLWGCFMA